MGVFPQEKFYHYTMAAVLPSKGEKVAKRRPRDQKVVKSLPYIEEKNDFLGETSDYSYPWGPAEIFVGGEGNPKKATHKDKKRPPPPLEKTVAKWRK